MDLTWYSCFESWCFCKIFSKNTKKPLFSIWIAWFCSRKTLGQVLGRLTQRQSKQMYSYAAMVQNIIYTYYSINTTLNVSHNRTLVTEPVRNFVLRKESSYSLAVKQIWVHCKFSGHTSSMQNCQNILHVVWTSLQGLPFLRLHTTQTTTQPKLAASIFYSSEMQ